MSVQLRTGPARKFYGVTELEAIEQIEEERHCSNLSDADHVKEDITWCIANVNITALHIWKPDKVAAVLRAEALTFSKEVQNDDNAAFTHDLEFPVDDPYYHFYNVLDILKGDISDYACYQYDALDPKAAKLYCCWAKKIH